MKYIPGVSSPFSRLSLSVTICSVLMSLLPSISNTSSLYASAFLFGNVMVVELLNGFGVNVMSLFCFVLSVNVEGKS